jgi:hypothetical protein
MQDSDNENSGKRQFGGAQPGAGRPTFYGKTMKLVAVRLREDQVGYAEEIGGSDGLAAGVRAIIDDHMRANDEAAAESDLSAP